MRRDSLVVGRCSQGLLLLHECLDTVDHVLDELLLGLTESSPVGDIEDTIIGLGVLTVDTSDLDFVLVGNSIESILVLHQLWKVDVDGGSHGGTEVGWARGDVTEMVIVGEFANSLDVFGGRAESGEHLSDVGTLLHRDNSELILLVDPDKESLGLIVENTSAGWPVPIETARLEESVSLPIRNRLIFRYN